MLIYFYRRVKRKICKYSLTDIILTIFKIKRKKILALGLIKSILI